MICRQNAETRRTWRTAEKKNLFSAILCALCASAFICAAQTTQVLFPINSLFGGAGYNKPITITAANTMISDGQNLWAGTYTIIPASTTNPVVGLYPNSYLMTVAGVVKPARFTVPASTNVLDVTTLLASGPLFYFGGSGLANLLAGTNVVFVTNSDGSITVNCGAIASYATNAGFAQYAGTASAYFGNIGVGQITNFPPQVLTNGAGGVTLSGAFIGDGSGLTNLNARTLVVSNVIAIYPHLTGTNVFWSTAQ